MADATTARLAVLIDADNASAKIVDALFEEIATLGDAGVRWIYGDFSNPHSKAWTEVLAQYAIVPKQQFAYVKGKNASDISLVIEAMDLLHSGRFDGFCLVSSDSDFTRLAQRIREEGVNVYGFGTRKTPVSFVQACRRFIYTENLTSGSTEGVPSQKPLKTLADATRALRGVIADMSVDNAWVALGGLGSQLANRASDFDSRNYGYKRLSDLVRALGDAFELKDEGGSLRVRLRRETPATGGKSSQKR